MTHEEAVRLYAAHCEKSGESFVLPGSGWLLTMPGDDTAWVLMDDDEALIATVWDDDSFVTTNATAQVVELEELFEL